MCGIAGEIDFTSNAQRDKDIYDKMLHRLSKRGTGNNGKSYIDNRACLLEMSKAENAQPHTMQIGDAQVVIVYDGNLFDTEELCHELLDKKHIFDENSDSAILLHSYLEWGEECVHRLKGAFSFAIWDGRTQTLFAARDQMGIRPLFYSVVDGRLMFGSEIKVLLCHPKITAEITKNGVAELLLIGPGRTPGFGVFNKINELKPGHYAVYSQVGLEVKCYWRFTAKEHEHSFTETVEYLSSYVKKTIRSQADSDTPICAFLSGGLDSSTITALSGVKNTFSVDYSENEKYFKANDYQPNSDKAFIDCMVKALGINHTNIVIETDELVDALFDAVEARDLPGMADVDSSLLLFCRKVAPHASIALSGECADELFGGYPWYRNSKILMQNGFPWSQSTGYRASFANKEAMHGIDPSMFVQQKYDMTLSDTESLDGESYEEKRMREMFRLNTDWFMQTLIDRTDRMSSYGGLEVRVPFCDYGLAQYLYNVPWEYKNYKNREKGILRESLVGVLPDEVLWRKKSPYPKTHHPDYLQRVTDILRDILNSKNAPIHEIVERSAVESLLTDNDGVSDIPWYGQLMTKPQTIAYFIQLNVWMELYGVTLAAE